MARRQRRPRAPRPFRRLASPAAAASPWPAPPLRLRDLVHAPALRPLSSPLALPSLSMISSLKSFKKKSTSLSPPAPPRPRPEAATKVVFVCSKHTAPRPRHSLPNWENGGEREVVGWGGGRGSRQPQGRLLNYIEFKQRPPTGRPLTAKEDRKYSC